MHFSVLSLALPFLPLIIASPVDSIVERAPAPLPLDIEVNVARSENSSISTRTFNYAPSTWGNGGWWGINECADASKSAICFSRGWGWGCNRQCICIAPPSYDGCKDNNKWNNCRSKGHGWGCNNKCECVPPPQTCADTKYKDCQSKGKGCNQKCECECRPWVKFYCQKKGGWLTSDCQCQLPSKKASHPRNMAKIKRGLCPETHSACAIDPTAKRPLFECVDTRSALDSCGGCSSEGEGVDCTQIEGADEVTCLSGKCIIGSCAKGYTLSSDKSTCESTSGLNPGLDFNSFLQAAEEVLTL